MSHRITTGTAAALALVAALAAGSLPARAEEPEACATPRFSDVGWTDISATTAVAGLILKNLGYTPKIDILSVAVTYEALPRGDIDVFLGNWMPLQEPTQKPLVDAGKIDVPRRQPRGRDHRLRRAEGGVRRGAEDLCRHREVRRRRSTSKIYGIEAGSSANATIARDDRRRQVRAQGLRAGRVRASRRCWRR